ncbi:MAG: hypothetical protein DMD93_12530 [Candidatus Rokuibacteriota bacterium]|nr:MAG: hypothetical protein DMD93_12530 [Candidatus Rokubacteria bacterium]
MASGWREQYDRMKRWHKRVQRDRIDPDAVRDSFFAFTQACYHLVDWLENDKSQPIRRCAAEQFVEESAILRFCRDICNGSKHARLETKKVKMKDRSIRLDHESVVWELSVEYQDQSYTAAWFAGMCISEWNQFLREHKLLKERASSK